MLSELWASVTHIFMSIAATRNGNRYYFLWFTFLSGNSRFMKQLLQLTACNFKIRKKKSWFPEFLRDFIPKIFAKGGRKVCLLTPVFPTMAEKWVIVGIK